MCANSYIREFTNPGEVRPAPMPPVGTIPFSLLVEQAAQLLSQAHAVCLQHCCVARPPARFWSSAPKSDLNLVVLLLADTRHVPQPTGVGRKKNENNKQGLKKHKGCRKKG